MLISWLLFIIAFFLLYLLFLNTIQEGWDEQKRQCDEIAGCGKYGCYAELPNYPNRVKTNFLLQEQNCLLRKGK